MKLAITREDNTLTSPVEWQDLREGIGADIVGQVTFDYEVKETLTIDVGGDSNTFELDIADHPYDSEEEIDAVVARLMKELEEKLTEAGLRA